MGHSPSTTENSNFPIQSGAADIFNTRLPELARKLPSQAKLVAHVYDAGYIETPKEFVNEVSDLIMSTFEAPIEFCGQLRSFPVEVHVGERWSDV
jgi:DNA polymerase I-like protein with 3'-5' exonuclease and polymerase domains